MIYQLFINKLAAISRPLRQLQPQWLILQGLATGSLFYVVFFEILEKERQKNVNGLLQVIIIHRTLMSLLLIKETRS